MNKIEKILLVNLNKYLGGGEVLAVRMATFLIGLGINVEIIGCKNSYLENECIDKNIAFSQWPMPVDSVLYMNKDEKEKIIEFWKQKVEKETIIKCMVFSFCMRDIYNICFLTHSIDTNCLISAGVYHPREVFYNATKTVWAGYNKSINHNIYQQYLNKDAVLFMNDYTFNKTIRSNSNKPKDSYIVPLPINIEKIVPRKGRTSNERIRILSIGRFVDFKYYSVLNIIDFVKDHEEYELIIVGYGRYEKEIRKYSKGDCDRITFAGKVSPEKLKRIIDSSDIGYAMGTSVLECASAGLPTVIAPVIYPSLRNSRIRKNKCIGIFGANPSLELGELSDFDELINLDDSIEKIKQNYEMYSEMATEHVMCYSFDDVLNKYLKMWQESKFVGSSLVAMYPHISRLRFLVKRLLLKIGK